MTTKRPVVEATYDPVVAQYENDTPLRIRSRIHRDFSEVQVDLLEFVRERLRLEGSERILDIGSGPGTYLEHIRSTGHEGVYVAFDRVEQMASQAARQVRSTIAVVGDAESLPFPRASFDRVLALHMLNLVRDVDAASFEMARVVTPDGLVVVTANSAASLPGIKQLRDDLADQFALPRRANSDAHFGAETGTSVLDRHFVRVEELFIANALVFSDPEPIVRYVATSFPTFGIDLDSPIGTEMCDWLRHTVDTRLISLGGIWRDPRTLATWVCSGPRIQRRQTAS